jgi:hypothetical protein
LGKTPWSSLSDTWQLTRTPEPLENGLERKVKYLVAAMTLTFAAQSHAEFYAGGNAGVYLYDQEIDTSGVDDIEFRDYTLGLHGGYMFRDWIGAEIWYLNYLEAGESLGNDDVILRGKGDSFGLALRPAWRISHDFELFAKLGVSFWDTKAKIRYSEAFLEEYANLNLPTEVSDDGSDFVWGGGGRWWGGDQWSLALEFLRIEADTEVQFDSVTFNVAYHF